MAICFLRSLRLFTFDYFGVSGEGERENNQFREACMISLYRERERERESSVCVCVCVCRVFEE